jgi:HPt (histidine-containing phosphotransfer) domain-containing protein
MGTPSLGIILLDSDYALDQAGGDSELLARLCQAFLDSLPVCMEDFSRAIAHGDFHRAGIALLHLQSYMAAFGFGHVSCTALQLEYAVRNRRLRQTRKHWRQLRRQLRILAPQVQHLLLEMFVPSGTVH